MSIFVTDAPFLFAEMSRYDNNKLKEVMVNQVKTSQKIKPIKLSSSKILPLPNPFYHQFISRALIFAQYLKKWKFGQFSHCPTLLRP